MEAIIGKLRLGYILYWRFQEEELHIRFIESEQVFEVLQQEWTDTDRREMNESELLAFLEQRFSSPERALKLLVDKRT